MIKNMGIIDRAVRITVALIIGYLYYTEQISSPWDIILLILAIIFLLTSVVGFCPLYKPLGINTCRKK